MPRYQVIPVLGPSTHPCRLFLGCSYASCRFQLEGAIREPSQCCPVCCPSPGLPQPTPLPPPQPHPMYCHGLFTHQSSPETANNLKAETVSGSGYEPCVSVAGSRCPNLVGVNNERMGGQAVGAQVDPVYLLEVGTYCQGLQLVEGDCLHRSC